MKYSIRYKFAIGLLIIFGLSYVFMSYSMNKIVMNNNRQVIHKELLSSQKDLNIYLKQYMMLNKIEIKQEDFQNHISQISDAIVLKLNNSVILFNSNGEEIFDSDKGTVNNKLNKVNTEDVSKYKILGKKNNEVVEFVQPIYIDDIEMGFLNYSIDYSDLFQSNYDLLRNMEIVIFIVFVSIFIVALLLIRKISTPIINLNKNTKEIAKGNFNVELKITSRDEVGELGDSFTKMKNIIKEQIDTIEKDRDNLIKLLGHRKTFFNNVTHEMKTPLTIISGYSQMILDENGENELINKAANKVKFQSDRLHNMIIELIEKSKIESDIDYIDIEELDMLELVSSVCDDMSIKAKKYEMIIEKYIEPNIYILANREEIIRLLINIIDNSIKYGNVKSAIKVCLYKEDEKCTITIEDRGKGISGHDLDMLFEPFYRANNNHSFKEIGSAGLGLTIAKAIIDKYQGSINIESKTNIGTRVKIIIPLFTNWQQID